MKVCTVCERLLEDDAFSFNRQRGAYNARCKQCDGDYQRNRRLNDPEKFRRDRRLHYARSSSLGREKREVLVLESGGECVRCGVKYDGYNLAIFHFHHRDPTTKSANIANLSLAASLDELDKCDLLCANCHALTHWYTNNLGVD